ncbi:DUF4118 domain-containing protein [Pseudolabrys sp. FHR47]|uniref:DUF4118 domain-containing protein n=1 Tax=Pseudolabrys sp. FHR47 TaxID=2562284 RepID=UPI0010BE38A2|nr:DUF4118 domain-containing protein [Pseudolabrys sp. FHR47]
MNRADALVTTARPGRGYLANMAGTNKGRQGIWAGGLKRTVRARDMPTAISLTSLRRELRSLLLTLGLVGIATVFALGVIWYLGLTRVSIIYLVPVLIAALRWGLVAALFASACGVAANAFLVLPPLFSFRIDSSHDLVSLLIQAIVAVTVSQLASRLKRELEHSRQREIDLRDLYDFSRRIAVAFDVAEIQAAIEDHLTTVIQREVLLFASARDAAIAAEKRAGATVPQHVYARIAAIDASDAEGKTNPAAASVMAGDEEIWLVRAVSPKSPEFGVVAVNLGHPSQGNIDDMRVRVDAVLADATATLDRLGIAQAINEARMRAETDQLRDALIGSVSHELRTPLASILGAATVLSTAPALAAEPKLRALALDVRSEAERLNSEIQNLIDATRISSDTVKPRMEWADPADILDTALESCRKRLAQHKLTLNLPQDLPLIHVDPVLVKQALVQVFDNAAKYSPPGSTITVAARARDGRMILNVSDEGAGLTAAELPRIWDRFARGGRTATETSGSGLGLWIARSFIDANGGKMNAVSDGLGRGTTMAIELPVAQAAVYPTESDRDE